MDPFTLDDATALRLLDEQALQRRLDARNRRVLPAILWPLVFFWFAAVMSSHEEWKGRGWPLGALGMALAINQLVLLRVLLPVGRDGAAPARPPRAALVARFGQILQGVLLLHYLIGIAWTTTIGARPVPLFVFAVVLLAFRLVISELLLMHGVALVAGAVVWWIAYPAEVLPVLLGALPLHAFCCWLGYRATRRYRATFLDRWQARVGRAREQVRVTEELALAREVQLSMLPACMPDLPWADVCATTVPATEVGGDYYDFFTADGSLAVVVADVAGHGVASGLVLASVRSGLALLMEEPGHELASTMARLDALVRRTSRRMLVTLALVRYDRATSELLVSTAGHPPVLVRRTDGAVEEVVTPSPPLGTKLGGRIAAARVAFAAGDCALLYSDGLVETADEHGASYGAARLRSVLAAHGPQRGAAELVSAILADLGHHRGDSPQQDDVTLVALVAR